MMRREVGTRLFEGASVAGTSHETKWRTEVSLHRVSNYQLSGLVATLLFPARLKLRVTFTRLCSHITRKSCSWYHFKKLKIDSSLFSNPQVSGSAENKKKTFIAKCAGKQQKARRKEASSVGIRNFGCSSQNCFPSWRSTKGMTYREC